MIVLLLACTPEEAVTLNNSDSSIIITSHQDGDVLFTDEVIEFRAVATDTNDNAQDLEVQWRVGERVACPFAPPDAEGTSLCATTLDEGEDAIQAEVRDPQNATGVSSISVDLQISDAPAATILQPVSSGLYYSDVLIEFQGLVSDAEDLPEDLTVA